MDVRTVDDRITDSTARAHYQVKCSGRQGALTRNDFSQCPGTGRHKIGGLEDHRVTKGERRRDFPDGSCHGKVPWADDRNNTDRLPACVDFNARSNRLRAIVDLTVDLSSKVVEELSRPIDFTNTLSARFSLFAGEQFAQFAAPSNELIAYIH